MNLSFNVQNLAIRANAILMVLVCWFAGIGCAIGGKSASIDSNSRVPFFGLELQERRRHEAAPNFRSIRLDQASDSRVEPIRLNSNSPSKEVKSKDRRGQDASIPLTFPRTEWKGSSETKTSNLFDFR